MIPEKVLAILRANDLKFYEFPEGTTPTAVTAAETLKVKVGQIAKSILFYCKRTGPVLVVCPGDRKVVSSKLKKAVGEKGRLTDPVETEELTGFAPGGVCPFGLSGIRILIDEHLKGCEPIYPAAGTSGSAVRTSFEELVTIVGGEVVDLTDPRNPSSQS